MRRSSACRRCARLLSPLCVRQRRGDVVLSHILLLLLREWIVLTLQQEILRSTLRMTVVEMLRMAVVEMLRMAVVASIFSSFQVQGPVPCRPVAPPCVVADGPGCGQRRWSIACAPPGGRAQGPALPGTGGLATYHNQFGRVLVDWTHEHLHTLRSLRRTKGLLPLCQLKQVRHYDIRVDFSC